MDEVKNYETELKSMTGGRGSYTMELSHYDIVPSHLVPAIIAEAKKDAGKDGLIEGKDVLGYLLFHYGFQYYISSE